MALTPEQKAAWEREKAERERRKTEQQELIQSRMAEQEKIDQAIQKVEKKEKTKKLLIISSVIGAYGLIALWYFVLR